VAGGYSELAAAEANGTAFAPYMGASTLPELRALTADEIVTKVYAQGAPAAGTSFGNVLDGHVLPKSYTAAMTSRTEYDVPVLTGNSKDENGGRRGRVPRCREVLPLRQPVRHGPPVDGHGLPVWPALRTSKPVSMELGDHFAPLPAADSQAKYAFLTGYLESQTTEY
jgi:hypothetical protein